MREVTTAMKKEAIKQLEYVISLAAKAPEHREDASKAFDALDVLIQASLTHKRELTPEPT